MTNNTSNYTFRSTSATLLANKVVDILGLKIRHGVVSGSLRLKAMSGILSKTKILLFEFKNRLDESSLLIFVRILFANFNISSWFNNFEFLPNFSYTSPIS